MSDLIHHPETAKVVWNDDRPVMVVLASGVSFYTTMRELFDMGDVVDLDIAVLSFSPDPEHADFVHTRDVETGDSDD